MALFVCTLCTSAFGAGLAPPTTTPASQPAPQKFTSLAEAKAAEQAELIEKVRTLPGIEAKRIEDVVKLSIKDKLLRLDTTVAPTDESSVRVPGLPGFSTVKMSGVTPPDSDKFVMMSFNFDNHDITAPNVISLDTSVSFAVGNLSVTQAWETLNDEVYQVQLIQSTSPNRPDDQPTVVLYVQTPSRPSSPKFSADNMVELRRKYPAEVAKYVDPMFRALRQEGMFARVDPKLTWQVFPDAFAPSTDLTAQIKALVAKLDASDFQEREAASRELEQIGQPAALVLMRLDRKGLSDEQISRIDAFCSPYRTVTDAEAERYRNDRDFLLDCLYSDDEPIRKAALAQLKQISGKDVPFDVGADPEQRLIEIDKLRQVVGSASTRPSEDRPPAAQ